MGAQQRRRLLADGRWTDGRKPKRGDTIPCSVCGMPFYRQPAYIAQGRHLCSRACNKAWQSRNRVTKACRQCGSEFAVPPSQQATTFCGRTCEVASRTTGAIGRLHNGRPVLKNQQGYLTVYEPTHPFAHKHNGRMLEHRLVMEQKVGRLLRTSEHVNHINHIRDDNRPENLEIMTATDHAQETAEWTRKKRVALDAELEALRAKVAELEAERESLNGETD
jgi:hypothetical protein